MKPKILIIVLALLILNQACEIYEPEVEVDYIPPSIPSGVVVSNGDERVYIYWDNNREADLAGYNIYVSDSYDGRYELIGSSNYNNFIDYGAVNGELYYYAVTAYDFNGNESELSYEDIYATPRPEGFNQAIFDYNQFPNNSGYSFAIYSVVAYDSIDVDFFFENFQGNFYLNVWSDTDIQDMGPTNDIYDIEFAPTTGWSSTKDASAIEGHTYVFWTWNNHFAKVRISSITSERVVFDWAYQLAQGNIQLKPSTKGDSRAKLYRSFIR
ncbi:MAG: hypothetical protein P8X73_09010 [Ignavibacteriaceae bacterium]